MKRNVAVLIFLLAIPLGAQQPAPAAPSAPKSPQAPAAPATPAPPAPAVDPEQGGQPINIRLDVSISDQGSTGGAQPKTLMVMLADRATARTRGAFEDRSVSVDARPRLVDGRIRLSLTIESRGHAPGKNPDPTLFWQNSFALLLDNGKPMIALETVDDVTKKKLSIEVKATIQK
jgi:hypothetical protein